MLSSRATRAWLVLALVAALVLGQLAGTSRAITRDEHVVFILVDGTNADTFKELLDAGRLPWCRRLLDRGRYIKGTTVWPSTTGPGYAPFITGLFPKRSRLPGIRWFGRDWNFRVYCGTDVGRIDSDLNPDYPTIYELLPENESVSVMGFLKRGSEQDRISVTGLITQMGLRNPESADHQATATLINEIVPPGFLGHLTIPGLRVIEGQALLLHADRLIHPERTISALGRLPAFTFISLHSPDSIGHQIGTGTAAYRGAIVTNDRCVGYIYQVVEKLGLLDRTTFIISSDHGSSPVEPGRHFDVAAELAKATGIPIHGSVMSDASRFNSKVMEYFRSPKKWERYAGVAAVSGNANVQFYFKDPASGSWDLKPTYAQLRSYTAERFEASAGRFGGLACSRKRHPTVRIGPVDLIGELVGMEAVAYAAARDGEGQYRVIAKDGEATIERGPGGFSYSVSGADPLGYASYGPTRALVGAGNFFSAERWQVASVGSDFPDAVVQIAQLLDAWESGDIIVDAAPGWEPWTQDQEGLHGSLRAEHMEVPILLSGPRIDRTRRIEAMRTTDIFVLISELLGLESARPGKEIDGVSKGLVKKGTVP